jgi:histidine triad (HIT) family protein
MDNCIFCKIAQKEIPANILYEDELFMAILDVFPTSNGHTLIIPKKHARDFYDLPVETAAALLPLAQGLAWKIKDTLHPDGLNIIQNNGKAAGQSVFHYHLHLIPRYGDNDGAVKQGKPLTITPEELEKLAERLRLDEGLV